MSVIKDKFVWRKVVILCGDIAILCLSLFLALLVRLQADFSLELFRRHLVVFIPILIAWPIVSYLSDLYDLRKIKNIYLTLYQLYLSVIINMAIATAYFYIMSLFFIIAPKTILIIFAFLALSLMTLWRLLFYRLFNKVNFYKRVLIIGVNEISIQLAHDIKSINGISYKIIGIVRTSVNDPRKEFQGIRIVGGIKKLKQLIIKRRIDEVVIAYQYHHESRPIKYISDAMPTGVKIVDWPIFYEEVYGKVPIQGIDHFWFVANIDESEKINYERIKRIVDVVISFFGVLILCLIYPFVGLAIKLNSKGSVLYTQNRVGKDENEYQIYKFRTMYDNAEHNGPRMAKKSDKRVTRVGRFLRKTRIDEIPQFINVLKGEMSLVGPRPERPEFVRILNKNIPFYYKRNGVRPGVTGYAQIMYPYASTIEDSMEKVGFDLYYIKNRSLFLYFKIVLRTIRVMLSFSGR